MWSLPDCNLLYCIVIKEVNEVFGAKNRMSTQLPESVPEMVTQ